MARSISQQHPPPPLAAAMALALSGNGAAACAPYGVGGQGGRLQVRRSRIMRILAAGASCRVALARPSHTGDNHVYSVRKVPRGWLRGQITLPDGSTLKIADLQPGPGAPTPLTSLYNFVEYFGPMVARPDLVPRSVIEFHNYWPATRTTAARLEGVCATAVDNGTGGGIVKFGGAC